MKSSTDYKPNLAFAVLLQGPPGAGKTTLAGHFPNPYFLDCDNNLSGAARRLKKEGIEFRYDTIDQENDKPTMPQRHWPFAMACLEAAKRDPWVKTIVIDSATKFYDYAKVEIMRLAGHSKMEWSDWDALALTIGKVIDNLRVSGKMVIMTAHEKPEKDEVGGMIKYFLAIQGGTQHTIGGRFSDVWRCEVEEKGQGHVFQVRTMPNYRCQLKNSLGLPPTFEMKWEDVAKALRAGGEHLPGDPLPEPPVKVEPLPSVAPAK
jgi:hypothetical protein